MTSITITIDDEGLAQVVIHAIDSYYQEQTVAEPDTQQNWIGTTSMAKVLGISIRTIHSYRESEEAIWQEGRHYKRRTPAAKSSWVWNKDLTVKAWEEGSK